MSQSERKRLETLANILVLEERIRDCDDMQALSFLLANDTATLFPSKTTFYWQVSAYDTKSEKYEGHITTISNVAAFDKNSSLVRSVQQWVMDIDNKKELLWTSYQPQQEKNWIVWIPVTAKSGDLLGGIILITDQEPDDSMCRLAVRWGKTAGHTLSLLLIQNLKKPLITNWTKKRKWLFGLVVIFGICLLPVRMNALAPAFSIPKDPMFIQSSLDSVISSVEIEPSQMIKEGDLLIQLERSDLETRKTVAERDLQLTIAELQQAVQSANWDTKAKAQIPLLKVQQEKRQAELDYVAGLLERSSIRSTTAGMAIFADKDSLIGKPVKIGERLLTVADPRKSALQIYLAAGDDIDIKVGGTIVLYPDSDPLSTYYAKVTEIAFEAEMTPEGILAFSVKANFTANSPQIGTYGTAKFIGPHVPLGYMIIRRPVAALRQLIGI